MKIIDGIIKEPVGGAHRDPRETADNIKKTIKKDLASLCAVAKDKLVNTRYDRIRAIGVFKEP
jgi:acetyl-CoA carboxylase carboxyl transferase subunit alpha